jgi:hypothetical protein
MKTHHNASEATILARMAATRAELVAANHVNSVVASARRGVGSHQAFQRGPIFLQSPYAALIAGGLVISVILGPKYVARTAARRALTSWMTSTFRSIFHC